MFHHISKLKDFDKDLNNLIGILDKDAYDARSITEIVKKKKKGIRMIGMLMAEILESLGGKINFGKGSSLKREDWKKLAKGLGCSIFISEKSTKGITTQCYGEKNLFTKPIKILQFDDELIALYGRRYTKELVKGNILV